MIIQCEQCNTKFRLDDSKVKDTGVKVRCAKCKHVFTVTREQCEPEPAPAADFGTLLEQSGAAGPLAADAAAVPSPPEQPEEQEKPFHGAEAESDTHFSFDFSERDLSGTAQPESGSFAMPAAEPAESAGFGEFTFPEDDSQQAAPATEQGVTGASEMDFGSFDFGDTAPETAGAAGTPAPAEAPEPSAGPEAPQEDFGFDFGGENLFGDAVATPVEEEPAKDIKFDLGISDFADSMGIKDSAGENGKGGESAAEAPFSLGEIDFGDELSAVAVQQVNPDELKPAQDLLFAPLAETATVAAKPDEAENAAPPAAPEDELPPLSISSRRKENSLAKALMGVAGAAAVAALGFFGYSQLSEEKPKAPAADERITIRSVDAYVVKNKENGELLVITGEALNGFKTPRAALQVKGLIYGANGQVISTRNAFAGNPLSREQLTSMPLEKIEATMANQFGDSLSNLEVVPGKAIPFMIVLPRPGAGAKDYGVEAAGSTVSTGTKQQQ